MGDFTATLKQELAAQEGSLRLNTTTLIQTEEEILPADLSQKFSVKPTAKPPLTTDNQKTSWLGWLWSWLFNSSSKTAANGLPENGWFSVDKKGHRQKVEDTAIVTSLTQKKPIIRDYIFVDSEMGVTYQTIGRINPKTKQSKYSDQQDRVFSGVVDKEAAANNLHFTQPGKNKVLTQSAILVGEVTPAANQFIENCFTKLQQDTEKKENQTSKGKAGGSTLTLSVIRPTQIKTSKGTQPAVEIVTGQVGDSIACVFEIPTRKGTVHCQRLSTSHNLADIVKKDKKGNVNPEFTRLKNEQGFVDINLTPEQKKQFFKSNEGVILEEAQRITIDKVKGKKFIVTENLSGNGYIYPVSRLQTSDGKPVCKRTDNSSSINMSRAIGDNDIPGISHVPEVSVHTVPIRDDRKMLLMHASDGLLERTSSHLNDQQYLCELFNKACKQSGKKPQEITEKDLPVITQRMGEIAKKSSGDNISISLKLMNANQKNIQYIGVADGHNGSAVSHAIYTKLPGVIKDCCKFLYQKITATTDGVATITPQTISTVTPDKNKQQPSAATVGHFLEEITTVCAAQEQADNSAIFQQTKADCEVRETEKLHAAF